MSHDLLVQIAYTKVLLKYSKTTKKATQIPGIIYNRQFRLKVKSLTKNNTARTILSVKYPVLCEESLKTPLLVSHFNIF